MLEEHGIENFFELYDKLKESILNRLSDFDKILERADEKEIFEELAFCLFTPQSKAVLCFETVSLLKEKKFLFEGKREDLVQYMRKVRFLNNKASYLIEARKFLSFNGFKTTLLENLIKFDGNGEKRGWLVNNVKGFGFKEASHFLRNIGFYKDIAILDRHILKNLVKLGVITEIPTSMSARKYCEIELQLVGFCEKHSILPEVIDFVLWYKEAGKIFK